MLHLPIRNRNALDAIHEALAQFVQNTEEIEDLPVRHGGLTPVQHAQLDEARKMQEWVDLVFIEGRELRGRRR